MTGDSSETNRLLERAAEEDKGSWGALLTRHREWLRRLVAFRMDQRLQGRIASSDVIQEVCLDAAAGWPSTSGGWPCLVSCGCEASPGTRYSSCTGTTWARRCATPAGRFPSTAAPCRRIPRPSEPAISAEAKVRLQEALNDMDPLDREVLALRHFEQLSPAETGQVLGISKKAAGMRYLRALKRLKEILTEVSGGPGSIDHE